MIQGLVNDLSPDLVRNPVLDRLSGPGLGSQAVIATLKVVVVPIVERTLVDVEFLQGAVDSQLALLNEQDDLHFFFLGGLAP